MKIKAVKKVLESLYFRGFYDGKDIMYFPKDRFCGDLEERKRWEKALLSTSYKELKKLI